MAVRCAEGEEVEDDGMWATLMYMAPEMFYEWHAHVVKTGGQVSVLLPPLLPRLLPTLSPSHLHAPQRATRLSTGTRRTCGR